MSKEKRDIETVVALNPLTEAEASVVQDIDDIVQPVEFELTMSEPMSGAVEGQTVITTNSSDGIIWSTVTYEDLWSITPFKRRTEVKLYKSILKS